MLGYKEHIKTQLQGALEWMCKPENQQPGLTAKLEGRYMCTVFFTVNSYILCKLPANESSVTLKLIILVPFIFLLVLVQL